MSDFSFLTPVQGDEDPRRIRPAARPLPPVTLNFGELRDQGNPVRNPLNVRDDIIKELFDGLFGIRRQSTGGDELAKRSLKVVHIHPTGHPSDPFDLKSSITVVYRPRYQDSHVLEYAISVCSPGDTFSKKVGLR